MGEIATSRPRASRSRGLDPRAARGLTLLSLALGCAGWFLAAPAAAIPVVACAPETTFVHPDSSAFEVSIWLEAGTDSIACFRIVVAFDSSRIVLEEATEGALYTESGEATFFDWEVVSAQRSVFVDCVLGYGTYLQGPGELVHLRFGRCPDATGVTQLFLDEVTLTDVARLPYPEVEIHSGYIQLTPASTAPEPDGAAVGRRLRVFPNPARRGFWIRLAPGDDDGSRTARVLDAAGRLRARVPLLAAGGGWQGWFGCGRAMEEPLRPGVYFVTVEPPAAWGATRVIVLGSGVGE